MKPGRQTLTTGFGLPFLFAKIGPAGRKNVVTVQNQNSYDSQIHELRKDPPDLFTHAWREIAFGDGFAHSQITFLRSQRQAL
jgi:hypothetical protein